VPRTNKAPASAPARPSQPTSRLRIEEILRERERLIAKVQSLGALDEHSEAARKAQQLLTRWWAKANWNAREELLKAAAWVLQIEKRH
jgi:hypothetical protein